MVFLKVAHCVAALVVKLNQTSLKKVKHENLDIKRVYKLRVKFLPQKHNEADVWSSKPQLRSLFTMVILRLSLFDALVV